MRLRSDSRTTIAVTLALLAGAPAVGRAQTPPPRPASLDAPDAAPAQSAPDAPSPEASELDLRQFELRGLEQSLRASEEQRRKIEAELEAIRTDRVRLTAAMIDTAARVQAAEGRVGEVEKQLDASVAGETAIRRSLSQRRGLISELLAGVQRMSHRPPPAILISPRDILKAIRISMMLGAVLPELRAETDILVADLSELVELRERIRGDREKLREEIASLTDERMRLEALVEARRAAIGEAEQAMRDERQRAQTLARQALDLKDLIARMEAEASGARRAAEAARQADDARKQAAGKPPANRESAFGDSGRLSPAIAFSEAKGLLPMPVSGEVRKSFGDSDGMGGVEKGLSIATRPGALVSAPADGWVSFSGPYRTYGQLLIINAGDGYYIVMAGMGRISVEVGQFVLAGEPVASMGNASGKTAAAIAIGAAQPILYVEFRKDGAAVDPGPWWAKPELEKVRG